MRCATAVLAVGLVVSGCGQEPTGRQLIRNDTAAVVKALNTKNYTAADSALKVLEGDIGAAERLQQLDADEVKTLRASVDKLRAGLALLIAPKPSPTPSPTRSSPRTDPPKGDDDDGKGKGKGRDD